MLIDLINYKQTKIHAIPSSDEYYEKKKEVDKRIEMKNHTRPHYTG